MLKRDIRFRMAFESFNPSTRAEADARLKLILDDLKKRGERALLGFDFPLGFPRGFAAALSLPGEQPWRAAWNQLDKMVKDKADNTNNRFGVGSEINRRMTGGPFPFWGCPPKDTLTTLQPKKTRDARAGRPAGVPPRRPRGQGRGLDLEALLQRLGRRSGDPGHPRSCKRLKAARGDGVRAWPFETGFKALTENDLEGVEVVVAEVYPVAAEAAGRARRGEGPDPGAHHRRALRPPGRGQQAGRPVRPRPREPPPTSCWTPSARKAGSWAPGLARGSLIVRAGCGSTTA